MRLLTITATGDAAAAPAAAADEPRDRGGLELDRGRTAAAGLQGG